MTPLQGRVIESYLLFRDQPMTIAGLFRLNRSAYLRAVLAFCALGTLAEYALGTTGAACVATAFAVMLLRDFGFYRRSVAIWPVVREVLDWKKIEQLASAPDRFAV